MRYLNTKHNSLLYIIIYIPSKKNGRECFHDNQKN